MITFYIVSLKNHQVYNNLKLQACCALLHFVGIYISVIWLATHVKQLQEKEGQNINNNFVLVQYVVSCILYFYMINFLWRWHQFLVHLVNDTYKFTVNTSKQQVLHLKVCLFKLKNPQ